MDIFATLALIAHLFSNATYIAGTIDLFQEKLPEVKQRTKRERWMTLIGIILGFSLGVLYCLTLPAASITFFACLSNITVTTGAISGLGSRFGGLGRRPPLEQKCLVGAATIGATLSLILICAGIPFMHITGVISFITVGSPVIASTVFVLLVTSLFMSGADYFSKAARYYFEFSEVQKSKREHEYRGSFCGAMLSTVAFFYFTMHLHLLTNGAVTSIGEFNNIATTITLFAKCFGVDGICSRIGRTLDDFKDFFESDDTWQDKTGKVLLVITGVSGLMVIMDMVLQAIDFLSGKNKKVCPVGSVTSPSETTTRRIEQQQKTAMDHRLPSPRPNTRLSPANTSAERPTAKNTASTTPKSYAFSLYCCFWPWMTPSTTSRQAMNHNKHSTDLQTNPKASV